MLYSKEGDAEYEARFAGSGAKGSGDGEVIDEDMVCHPCGEGVEQAQVLMKRTPVDICHTGHGVQTVLRVEVWQTHTGRKSSRKENIGKYAWTTVSPME